MIANVLISYEGKIHDYVNISNLNNNRIPSILFADGRIKRYWTRCRINGLPVVTNCHDSISKLFEVIYVLRGILGIVYCMLLSCSALAGGLYHSYRIGHEDEVSSLPEKERRTLKRNGVLLDVLFLSLLLIGIVIELVQKFSN